MFDKVHIQHGWVAVLAFAFGAAVVVPSLAAALVAIGSVALIVL